MTLNLDFGKILYGNTQAGSGGPLTIGQNPLDAMAQMGLQLGQVEDLRRGETQRLLENQMRQYGTDFAASENRLKGLFETQAGDAFGAQAKRGMGNLRNALGAGGIDPNSGAAQYRAQQVAGAEQAGIRQANTAIALDGAKRQEAFRNAMVAQGNNLAGIVNQSPSMIGLDTLTNLANFDLTKYGIDKSAEAAVASANAQKKAGKSSGIGSAIGAVASRI